MRWKNVKLIFWREVRDQLRDRRTLFMVAVLPLLLYPLLGLSFMQMSQFLREHPSRVRVLGVGALPSDPPLLQGQRFTADVCPEGEQRLFELAVDDQEGTPARGVDLGQQARRDIHAGRYDVLVYVPEDFADRLEQARQELARSRVGDSQEADSSAPRTTLPEPLIYSNSANDRSRIAGHRVERVLLRWRDAIVRQNLRASHIPESATKPFQVVEADVSEEVSRRAALWSKVLPFVAFVWALTGAFYPAVDLCAGEKERGTLETLLCSPALRSEIVWGKLLTTMVFSMATALLNLACIATTGALFVRQLEQTAGMSSLQIGVPPVWALGWLLLALIPLTALFSALSLAIASFARSSREGQYYLMPLLMVCLPLMVLPLIPSVELDMGTSIVPLTGVMLLMRALIEGQYAEAVVFFPPVALVTCGCCWLAIRWAIDQFNNESVLFRESERWDLQHVLVRMVRQRGDTPTVGQAVFCGVLLLFARFFAPFILGGVPETWSGFALSTAFMQVGMIAIPAVLLTFVLTRSPVATLLLRKPSLGAVLGAAMLALSMTPVGFALGNVIRQLYPLGPEVLNELTRLDAVLEQAPGTWAVVGLLAVLPAICEELAFRGFILSGLRHSGRPWFAIVLSSFFFGAVHSILQQSIATFLVGIVIAFLAVRTRSLFTTMVFHVVYNASALLLSLNYPTVLARNPGLGKVLIETPYGIEFQPTVAVASSALAAILLIWFNNLPAPALPDEILRQALDEAPRTPAARS